VSAHYEDIATGGVLLLVGIFDGGELARRVNDLNRFLRRGPFLRDAPGRAA
jgi:hypothetical protein